MTAFSWIPRTHSRQSGQSGGQCGRQSVFPIILHRIFHSQLRLLSLFARLEQILKLDYGHTRTVAREDSGTHRRMDSGMGELNKVRSTRTRTRLHCYSSCCCCCYVISSTFPLGTRRSHVVARWTSPDNDARGALRRAAIK